MSALLLETEPVTERWNGRKTATVVLAVTVTLLVGALLPETRYAVHFDQINQAPSLRHPFGTDWLGRDMLFRTLKGLSISIRIGLFSSVVSSVIALLLGIVFKGAAVRLVAELNAAATHPGLAG